MKKIVKGILPFLFLIFALTFMTKYKTLEDLTDIEQYDIRSFIEAKESQAVVNEKIPDKDIAHLDVEESKLDDNSPPVDPNMDYAITSDEKTVTVYDDNGNAVFETSLTNWEENRDYYYEKYRLGS